MVLSKLWLFSNVPVTRDSSVVSDLEGSDWLDALEADGTWQCVLHEVDVNYWRLPDVLRVEGAWELLRTADYGCLRVEAQPGDYRYLFFWVDSVRLVKLQATPYDPPETAASVVDLTVTEDAWATWHGDVTLHDSYVERRHMPRWTNTGTTEKPVWEPVYYPGAAQGVDGAYSLEKAEDLTPHLVKGSDVWNPQWYLVSVLGTDGKLQFYIGCDLLLVGGSSTRRAAQQIQVGSSSTGSTSQGHVFGLKEIVDGSLYTALGISAQYVQGISVLPFVSYLSDIIVTTFAWGDFGYDSEDDVWKEDASTRTRPFWLRKKSDLWVVGLYDTGFDYLGTLMNLHVTTVSNVLPAHDSSTSYADSQEPMLYLAPARQRVVADGTGASVLSVPDLAAFETSWTSVIDVDTTSVGMMTYPATLAQHATGLRDANAKGAVASVRISTLPVYESAWRTYEAISKTGDDISFNAQQVSNAVNGIVGAVTGLASAAFGGPIGALGGMLGGSSASSSVTSMYTTQEDLKAKRATIRNSPCTVVSTGAALGESVHGWLDVNLLVLKVDDVSFRKLADQYYYYGYFVNATEHGELDLHTRVTFDFIKTSGARVSGTAPSEALEEIRAIFDRGVTIYHGTEGLGHIGKGVETANQEYVKS